MILSLEEQMEFWKPYFQDTKKLLVTSAKGKQDCKNWHRHFSLTLFEFWYEINEFFFQKKLPSEAAGRRCSFKQFVLKTFSISTKKHLKAWRPATLLKIDSKTGAFAVTIR